MPGHHIIASVRQSNVKQTAPIPLTMRPVVPEDGLIDHIIAKSQFYGLTTDRKNIRVETHPDSKSGLTFLAVDVNYSTPVDLYYSTYQLRRHPPSRIYDVLSISPARAIEDWPRLDFNA